MPPRRIMEPPIGMTIYRIIPARWRSVKNALAVVGAFGQRTPIVRMHAMSKLMTAKATALPIWLFALKPKLS